MMTNIVQFLQYKNEKDEQTFQKLFQKANSFNDKLDALLQNKQLQVEDHKLFLAFLAYLEGQQIEPKQLFRDVIRLPKFQFEARYNMNWGQVVRLCVTFLSILQENDPESYKEFMF